MKNMIHENVLHYYDENAKAYKAYSQRELTEKIVRLEKKIKELEIDSWRSGYQAGYNDATETAVNIETNFNLKEV